MKEVWLKELQDLDCTYFVFNAREFLNCLSEENIEIFSDMLEEYNNSRGRIDKYFVVNREDYPRFKTAKEYINWLNKQYDTCSTNIGSDSLHIFSRNQTEGRSKTN